MSSKKLPYPIVEVAWVDSEHDQGWNTLSAVLEEQEKTLECRSVGYLITERADRVVLATSVGMAIGDDDEQISAYLTIPKASILWMKGPTKRVSRKTAQRDTVAEKEKPIE